MDHFLDSSIIASRLRVLRENSGLSYSKLAEALSRKCNLTISSERLRQYECFHNTNQESSSNMGMSVKVLHALADFYEVSTDYILGRTDVKSTDPSIRAIVEYTGLSEKNVVYLHQLKIGDLDEDFLDTVVAILEHDIMFRIKSDSTHYELASEMFDKMCGRTPEKTPNRKRQARITALQERKKYIHALINALNKRSIYTLNAINTLISNNNHLHLLEEIGEYISANPDDLIDRYSTSVGQTSTHHTDSQHVTGNITELLIEQRLSIITEKLKELREIVVSSTE